MYKIFITLRYLRARLITYLATVLVALGVMVFIVVLSVMSGFQVQFKERIRGTLSDLSLVRRSPEGDYAAVEAEIEKHPKVEAVAPRMKGLVLVGNRRLFEGAEIYGIDFEKEYGVGNLEQYLLTNMRLRELDLEDLFNKSRQLEVEIDLVGWTTAKNPSTGDPVPGEFILFVQEEMYGIFPQGRFGGEAAKEGKRKIERKWWFLVSDSGTGVKMLEKWERSPPKEAKGMHSKADDAKAWERYTGFIERLQGAYNSGKIPTERSKEILSFWDEEETNKYGLQTKDPWARPPGLDPTAEYRPVLVGIDLYRKFNLRRGSEIALTTGVEDKQEADKIEPRKWTFVVVGMFKTGMVEWDQRTIYARIEDLMDTPEKEGFLGRDQVDEVSVKLYDYHDADAVRTDLAKTLPNWMIVSWEDQRGNLLKAVELEKVVMGIILFMIVLLAVVTIMVVLILLVNEKTKDIGILRALGASRGGIIQVILVNGFVIGLVGSIIGAILGTTFVLNINGVEREIHDQTGWTLYPRDVYYLDKIPDQVNPFDVMTTVVITLSLCLILGFYPAWLAAKLDPVEAFHHE